MDRSALYRRVPTSPEAMRRHKRAVGDRVILVPHASNVGSKQQKNELQLAQFEITRLLPSDGQQFHYRIKDAATGRERVVPEDQIAMNEA